MFEACLGYSLLVFFSKYVKAQLCCFNAEVILNSFFFVNKYFPFLLNVLIGR